MNTDSNNTAIGYGTLTEQMNQLYNPQADSPSKPEPKIKAENIAQTYTSFLGLTEARGNVHFKSASKEGYPIYAWLHKASFCCAVAEMGHFQFSEEKEADDELMKMVIGRAWGWGKGLITATLTDAASNYYHDTLIRHGFVLGDRFVNPNTRRIIHRYNLYRKGYEPIK